MRFIGIDVGLSGAIAMIDHPAAEVKDVPTFTFTTKNAKAASGKRVRNRYDPAGMVSILDGFTAWAMTGPAQTPHGGKLVRGDMLVVLENVHAMPKQGVTSTFSTGMGMGMWLGILAALNLPFELVEPVVWKRRYGLLGTDKAAARPKAAQLFPSLASSLTRAKDHGRADALLLAAYGRDVLRGGA